MIACLVLMVPFVLLLLTALSSHAVEAKWCGVSHCGDETACLTRPCVGFLGHSCSESNVPAGTPCNADTPPPEPCRQAPSCDGLGACTQPLQANGTLCRNSSLSCVGRCTGASSVCPCDITEAVPSTTFVASTLVLLSTAATTNDSFFGDAESISGANDDAVWYIVLPSVLGACFLVLAAAALVAVVVHKKKRAAAASASAAPDTVQGASAMAIYGAGPLTTIAAEPIYSTAPPLIEDDDDDGGSGARTHMYADAPALDVEVVARSRDDRAYSKAPAPALLTSTISSSSSSIATHRYEAPQSKFGGDDDRPAF